MCEGFIELIKLINKNHYENENIFLYIITNTSNINNINIMYNKLIEDKKINEMELININTDDIYLNDLEQIYM